MSAHAIIYQWCWLRHTALPSYSLFNALHASSILHILVLQSHTTWLSRNRSLLLVFHSGLAFADLLIIVHKCSITAQHVPKLPLAADCRAQIALHGRDKVKEEKLNFPLNDYSLEEIPETLEVLAQAIQWQQVGTLKPLLPCQQIALPVT